MAVVVPTARRPKLLTHITPGYNLSLNVFVILRFVLAKSNKSAQPFFCPPLVQQFRHFAAACLLAVRSRTNV
jgi:hypothetical protein